MVYRGGGLDEAAGQTVTASQANRLPKYLCALPAGPNDRHGMFIPRLLLQLTQLSPGLMGSGGSCGRKLISIVVRKGGCLRLGYRVGKHGVTRPNDIKSQVWVSGTDVL